MAPLFAAASVLPVLSPCPAAVRVVHSVSSRALRPGLGFASGLRVRRAPGASGRGVEGGIPDERGDRSSSSSAPLPDPVSKPDPPIDDDEWGRGVDSGNSPPVVTDLRGKPGKPEAEPAAAADPPNPRLDDEWEGKGQQATAAEGAGPQEDEATESQEGLKRCLVDTVYGSELGFRASTEVRGEVLELVTQLEAANPTPAPIEAPDLLDGNWILVYTAYSELLPILAAGATPFVKVKQISQEIDSKNMTIVNASTLSTPFASYSFSATASFEVQSPSRIEVRFKVGSFQPPEISSSVDLPEQVDIFGQKISLGPVKQALNPLQEAFANIAGTISGQPALKVPFPGNSRGRSWLLTTYLDKDLRISRGDGGLFVLVKEGSPLLAQL